MKRLPALVFLVLIGCRDKQPAKQTPTAAGSGAAQAAGDAKWLDRLPTATGTNAVQLQFAAGLVRVDAAGAIVVANAPTAVPADTRHPGVDPFVGAKTVKLDELAGALGLPPVTPRTAPVFSTEAGSSAGSDAVDPMDAAFAHLGHAMPGSGAPALAPRVTTAFAVAHPHDVNGGVIVFADANAPAATLVDVLAQTGGFVAVRDGDGLGALSLALDRHAPAFVSPMQTWVEARLGPTVEVEVVPGKPAPVAAVDKLGAALPAKTDAVDVLVAPDTKVQDLVTALAQLRAANTLAVGLGRLPAPGGPGGRGDHGPRVVAWDVGVDAGGNNTASAAVMTALEAMLEPIRTCYTAELAKQPDLAGTARLELVVGANGKVANVSAPGAAKPLEACIVDAAHKIAALPPAGARITASVGFAAH